MKKKWLPIVLGIFTIFGVLVIKVYMDLSQPKEGETPQQQQTGTKDSSKLSKAEQIKLKDDSVKKLLVMLSNGDYKIPQLFDKKVFGKEYKDMDGNEVLINTESIFNHFLSGHRFYNGKILSIKRGNNQENDIYHIQIEFYQINYIDQKEMDIEINKDGKIVTPIKQIKKEHEHVEE